MQQYELIRIKDNNFAKSHTVRKGEKEKKTRCCINTKFERNNGINLLFYSFSFVWHRQYAMAAVIYFANFSIHEFDCTIAPNL